MKPHYRYQVPNREALKALREFLEVGEFEP